MIVILCGELSVVCSVVWCVVCFLVWCMLLFYGVCEVICVCDMWFMFCVEL